MTLNAAIRAMMTRRKRVFFAIIIAGDAMTGSVSAYKAIQITASFHTQGTIDHERR